MSFNVATISKVYYRWSYFHCHCVHVFRKQGCMLHLFNENHFSTAILNVHAMLFTLVINSYVIIFVTLGFSILIKLTSLGVGGKINQIKGKVFLKKNI